MKKIKLLIWMIVLLILDVSAVHYIRIFETVPSLVFAFVICTAVLDDEFVTAAAGGFLGGLLLGGLSVRGFFGIFLFYSLSGIAVYYLKAKPRYMNGIVKALIWCGILSAVFETMIYVVDSTSFSLWILAGVTLPAFVYNAVAAAAVYLLLKKSVYNKEEKKKILI